MGGSAALGAVLVVGGTGTSEAGSARVLVLFLTLFRSEVLDLLLIVQRW